MAFKKFLCLVLIFSFLCMCACQMKEQSDEREITVAVHNQSDEIYGIIFEYTIDRTRLGGQIASQNPEMTVPLNRDELYVGFSEKGFKKPEDLDNGTFGILVSVVLENGEQVPIEYLCEWKAAYGEKYHFNLSGDRKSGFSFAPMENTSEYTITPFSKLPEEFIR